MNKMQYFMHNSQCGSPCISHSINVYMYACVYVCVCVYIYIYIYIHITYNILCIASIPLIALCSVCMYVPTDMVYRCHSSCVPPRSAFYSKHFEFCWLASSWPWPSFAIFIHAYVGVCVCVRVCVRACVRACVCTYTHTNT
jgi:hypothetical protein